MPKSKLPVPVAELSTVDAPGLVVKLGSVVLPVPPITPTSPPTPFVPLELAPGLNVNPGNVVSP